MDEIVYQGKKDVEQELNIVNKEILVDIIGFERTFCKKTNNMEEDETQENKEIV